MSSFAEIFPPIIFAVRLRLPRARGSWKKCRTSDLRIRLPFGNCVCDKNGGAGNSDE